MQETHVRKIEPRLPTCTDLFAIHDSAPHTRTSAIGLRSNRSVRWTRSNRILIRTARHTRARVCTCVRAGVCIYSENNQRVGVMAPQSISVLPFNSQTRHTILIKIM